ncbi:MAG: PAS domain S-box protein [Methylococcales bacterium]
MTQNSTTTKNFWLITVQILLLAVLYFVVGQVSFSLSVSHHIVTLVIFAAEGFSLAAVILFGTRLWLGVFLGQLALALYNGLSWYSALGVSSINSVEAVIGAVLFHRLALQPSFEKVRDVAGLWLLIFLVLQPFSATLVSLVLWLDGVVLTPQLAISWFSWWFGNALGQILITPLLLSFFAPKKPIQQHLHGVLWLGLLVIPVGILKLLPISFNFITIVFTLTIPLLILIAVKSSMAMVNLATVIFTIIVLFITKQQLIEVFAEGDIILLVDLNVHLLAILLIGQFIAALLSEYKQLRLTQENDITESKQIATALRESEQKFRMLAESIPQMVWITRADGLNIYYNKQWINYTGLTEEECLGYGWNKHCHPDDQQSVLDAWQQATQTTGEYSVECRLCRADGVYRWWLVRGTPIRDTNGNILQWFGTCTDIDELKRTEKELKENEQKLKVIFDTLGVGISITDEQGNIIDCNKASENMLGISKQEHLQRNYSGKEWQIIRPDFTQMSPEEFASVRALKDNTSVSNVEMGIVKEQGVITWLLVSATPIGIKGCGVVIAYMDITAHKQSQNALIASEEKYRTLYNSIQDGIVFVDMQGTILECNQSYAAMLGYSEEELRKITFHQVTPEKWYSLEAEMIEREVINIGYCDLFEKEYIRKDGTVFPIEFRAWLVKDKQGNNLGMWAIVRDISKRKQLETELRQRHAELQQYFDQPFIGMLSATHDKKTLHANQHFCNMVGYSQAEMETIDWGKLTHPNDLAPNQAYLDQAIHGEINSYQMEKRFIHKDGHIVYVDLAVKFVRNIEGIPDYSIGMMLDITERKLIEQYLQKNQALLQTAQRVARLGHYVTDLKTGTWTNDTLFDEIFGIDSDFKRDFAHWQQLIFPEDKERLMNYYEQTLNDHEFFPFIEYRIIRPCDGRVHWIAAWGHNFYDKNNDPIQQVGMIQDITERKQAEIELRIAATVFESQEGMFVTDANCIILKINYAFTRITGYSATEVIGQTPSFLQSGRHDKLFYLALWQSINDTGVWQGEIWDKRKNGEIYPQWLTITAVKDKGNNVVTHYVATLVDITERKATEETINKLAFYDPLTQLPNRRLLQERLKHGIEVNHRTGSLMAVMMMDLDRFKAVNDNFGHAAGDTLLQQVAERIKNRLRKIDMVARLGGDEFVIVIDGITHYEDVAHIAEAIIQTLSQAFTLYETHTVFIGASIGIAFHPQHGDSPEILIDNADTALYHAKNQGRGCFAYYSDALKQKTIPNNLENNHAI